MILFVLGFVDFFEQGTKVRSRGFSDRSFLETFSGLKNPSFGGSPVCFLPDLS